MFLIIFAVFLVLVLIIAASCIRIVPQAHALIVERLGISRLSGEEVLLLKIFPLIVLLLGILQK